MGPLPTEAYAALPQHSRILSGAWRASVPLICFDIVEVHLPERVLPLVTEMNPRERHALDVYFNDVKDLFAE